MGRKPTKKPSFFKVMLDDFSDHLRIPRKFTKKRIRPMSPGKCVLRGPSGQRYEVELGRRENGWFFHGHGWHSFVKDHHLQFGYFLVFRYDGGSKFKVTVFDRTCCEKDVEVPKRRRDCPVGNPTQVKAEEAKEIDVQLGKRKNGLPATPSANEGYQLTWVEDEIIDLETEDYNRDHHSEDADKRRRNDYMSERPPRVKDGKGPSTGVIVFKSEYSCFKTILKERCSLYRVPIPMDLAMAKGLRTKKTVEIEDSTGRLWPAKLVSRKSKESYKICALSVSTGWGECGKANKIAVGDTVVFELVEQSVMRLHIFKGPGRRGGNNWRDHVVLEAPNIKKKAS